MSSTPDAIPNQDANPTDSMRRNNNNSALDDCGGAPSEMATRTSSPVICFDDWSEDPFTDAKESDVFAPFEKNAEANERSRTRAAASPGASHSVPAGRAVPPAVPPMPIDEDSRKRSLQELSRPQIMKTLSNSTSTPSSTNRSVPVPFSRRKKRPKGMPKRPLSAYNLYFRAERTKILAKQEENGNGGPRIGFEGLGKIIGKQWRDLRNAEKKVYETLAEEDGERYREEMDAYHDLKTKRYETEDNDESVLSIFQFPSVAASDSSSYLANGNSCFFPAPKQQEQGVASDLRVTPSQQGQVAFNRAVPVESGGSPPSFPPQSYEMMSTTGSYSSSHPSPAQGPRPTVSQRLPTPPLPAQHLSQQHQLQNMVRAPDSTSLFSVGESNINTFPLPPGMEIVLSDRNGIDRKYRVQYTCLSMTREEADQYLESMTGPPDISNNGNGSNSGGINNEDRDGDAQRSRADVSSHMPQQPPPSVQPLFYHMPPQYYSGAW